MTQQDFDAYIRAGAIEHLAAELSRSRDLTMEQAMEASKASFENAWPGNRVDTPDQYLYNVISPEGRAIGYLMFGVRRNFREPQAFIYDIQLDASERGKGYGAMTMQALEAEVRKLGIKRIDLNVFGHNTPAFSLYQKLGYTPVAIHMSKKLTTS